MKLSEQMKGLPMPEPSFPFVVWYNAETDKLALVYCGDLIREKEDQDGYIWGRLVGDHWHRIGVL